MNFFENTTLSTNTKKQYNTKIAEFIEMMPKLYKSLISIIMFPDVALRALNNNIKTNSPENRHIYLVPVASFLKHNKSDDLNLLQDDYLKMNNKWMDIVTNNQAPVVERRLENKPTEKQEAKGGSTITWEQIIKKRDELPVGSQDRLLISIYTFLPPVRADYFATEIVYKKEVPTQKNYVRVLSKNNIQLFLFDFKTAKTYKQIHNKFPPELCKEFLASLKAKPRKYLFTNTKGEPYTRNAFVLWTRRTLSRIFETDFTLVFFRHAFITDYMANKITKDTTDAQIKAISDSMGHSTEMMRSYKWIKENKTN